MTNPKPCAHCIHWQPSSASAYFAPCAVGYGRTAYNDTCDAHTPHPVPTQQSQARGDTPPIYQMWQMTKGKP